MQDDAIQVAIIHQGNRAEMFMSEPSKPALSYEHIENFTEDLEARRDLETGLMWRGAK